MSITFKKAIESNNVLMIVDSLNLAFRYKHSGATDFATDYIRTVDSFKKSYKASHVIIACDQGSSSYRKALSPEYKQNRKDKQEQQTDAERAAFEIFFEDFMTTIEMIKTNTSYPVLRFPGVEADDIAAYIATNKDVLEAFDEIWLISSDRDWDLLVQPKVSRFSYVTRKEVTIDNWSEHYECTPDQYISIKCLMGDSGDNIAGVDKIGPKTAQKLVDQYGTTLDIAAHLPLPGKYVYIKNLNSFGSENLIRNYQLMDLVTHCREAIGTDNIATIDETLEIYLK
jgi:DNA polymerase-1